MPQVAAELHSRPPFERMMRIHEVVTEIFDEVIRFGGITAGEQGVGVVKRDFVPEFLGEASLHVHRELAMSSTRTAS